MEKFRVISETDFERLQKESYEETLEVMENFGF